MTNTISLEGMSDLIDAIGQGGGGGGSSTLSGLSDVTITSASNGDVLTYDSTSEKWENTAAIDDLSDLNDVAITSATDGQVLTYDATSQKWKNASAGGGSGSLSFVDLALSSAEWEETSSGSGEWSTYVTFEDLGITDANDIISVMVCMPTNAATKNIPKKILQVVTFEKSSSTHLELHVKNATSPSTAAYLKIIYA